MKRTIAPTTLAVVFATVLVLGNVPSAQAGENKECSNATLEGSFAYASTGFNTAAPAPVGPFAEVGTQYFDGKGATTGAATINANGILIYQLSIKGTYTVNPDCTGTFALEVTFPPASGVGTIPVPVFFAIGDDGAEIQALETGPGAVITRIYNKQFRDRRE